VSQAKGEMSSAVSGDHANGAERRAGHFAAPFTCSVHGSLRSLRKTSSWMENCTERGHFILIYFGGDPHYSAPNH